MPQQNLSFPEMHEEPPQAQPSGFRYTDNILDADEETALAESLRHLHLKPFEFHGHLGNRRVVSFGLRHDYSRRSVEAAPDMPSFLDALLRRAAEFSGCPADAFAQVGINQYPPGAGVGWHKDKPQFGVIVGVSLLAPATMRFRRPTVSGWERISQTVHPRSIYIISGEARTDWEHSVPPVEALRYSINFRTLPTKSPANRGAARNHSAPRPEGT
jgi:alkylated DNA repair dioxygenase AlkB